jgi:hypothetical protein
VPTRARELRQRPPEQVALAGALGDHRQRLVVASYSDLDFYGSH